VSGILVTLSQASDYWKTAATHPILRYIAIRSYSLYLVHVEAIAILKYFQWTSFLFYALATWALSIALAEVLYRWIERPGMQWRDRKRSIACP
jgi:peptidoglycan/LPS O-acetylase OafA/YrhL